MMRSAIMMASCAFFVALNTASYAQGPIVVLEYPTYQGSVDDSGSGVNRGHAFIANPDYSASHRVGQDETLSHIMADYYGGSGLDMSVVKMAIVKANKHAFVRGNANFLFADKVLHLPSLTEMKNMVLGTSNNRGQSQGRDYGGNNQIYFIGG